MTGTTRRPVSARCDPQVWDAARAAAQGMTEVDPGYTLSDLLERALTAEVRRLEIEHHGGAEWPAAHSLRRGRRPAS